MGARQLQGCLALLFCLYKQRRVIPRGNRRGHQGHARGRSAPPGDHQGHRLRRADREQLRPAPGEIEATGPQQRRQSAGEVGGRPGHPAAPARPPGPRQRAQRAAWRLPRATGCAALIGSGCAQQKRGRSRFSMRFANRLQTVCNHAAERLRAIYAESSREMLREVV